VLAGPPAVDGAPTLGGIYFGLFAAAGSHGDKRGTVYDGSGVGVRARAPLHCAQLFEQGCRSAEGTTTGYVRRGDGVVPRTKSDGADREAEIRAEPAIAVLQAGVLACADRWRAREATATPARLQALREQVHDRLLAFIFTPTARERAAMAELTWSEDLAVLRHAALVPSATALLRPRRWLRELRDSPWKPGYLARAGGSGLGWAYRWYQEARLRLARK
jgi:hypothetical protein